MAPPETTPPPRPLIPQGSNVFAAIAATALLVGGLAGIARSDTAPSHGSALPSSELSASSSEHGGADHTSSPDEPSGHAHDEAATATGVQTTDRSSSAAHAHGGVSPQRAAGTAASGDDHHAAAAPSTSHPDGGHADHNDASGGPDHASHEQDEEGHAGHDAGGAGDHHHATGCADNHPTTVSLVGEVQGELATTYKDVAALVALGYHPYFDSLVPGGYPPGGEGISHWINPNYIDDGVVLDPQRPETILLDDWYWPIGMMFINDPGVPPVPVYVNDDGTACSPWHPHTDAPARFGWYWYRAMYDRELEDEVPAQTPEMMHVWAIANPAGVYAAHDYPPREARNGPPGPLPSYFSDVTIPGG